MKLELHSIYGNAGENEHLQQTYVFLADEVGVENELINLYPEIHYQTIEGFGGAITDAAGYVYSLMNEEQKQILLKSYFSPEGMNYNRVRIHMDSCDFSTGLYEAMSNPDETFDSFSMKDTEKYILPLLADAQAAHGAEPLKIMLSPWSPPAFMKTNGERCHGGSLRPEYKKMWAQYICRYIQEFRNRGYQVERISVQNEAKAWQTWDSCIYTAEEEKEFVEEYLYPTLVEHGLGEVEIFFWDHNKERLYERARIMMDGPAKDMVSGIAFHWYSGDHFEGMDLVHALYPDLKMILSENCIEYSVYGHADQTESAKRLMHEMIGDLNHGMQGFYDWNILLDETGGPNHVGNLCEAAFMYDRQEKKLQSHAMQKYFYQVMHYVKPGAKRIAHTKYSQDIEVASFCNPDGTIAIIMVNTRNQEKKVCLRLADQIVELMLPAQAVASGIIS